MKINNKLLKLLIILGGLSATPAFAIDAVGGCGGGAFIYGVMNCYTNNPSLKFTSSSMWGVVAFQITGKFHTDSADVQELIDAGNRDFKGGGALAGTIQFNAGKNTSLIGGGAIIGGFTGSGSWHRSRVESYASLYARSDVKKINSRLTDIYQNTYVATDKGIYKQSANSNKWELVGTVKKNMTMFLIDNNGRLISSDGTHIYTFNTSNNTWDMYPDAKLIRNNQSGMDNKTITGIIVDNNGNIQVS